MVASETRAVQSAHAKAGWVTMRTRLAKRDVTPGGISSRAIARTMAAMAAMMDFCFILG